MEGKEDVPEDAEHSELGNAVAVQVAAESVVERRADEDGSPGVTAVVEQLPQGRGGTRSPCLFSIDSIERMGGEEQE